MGYWLVFNHEVSVMLAWCLLIISYFSQYIILNLAIVTTQLNHNSKVAFDTKMNLHHPPPTQPPTDHQPHKLNVHILAVPDLILTKL